MSGTSRAVGKVADTFGKFSDNKTKRQQLKDAGRASQRRLNERDQDKSFIFCGWRVVLAWGLTFTVVYHLTIFPIILLFLPEAREPDWDMHTIMGMLSFLLGGLVAARSYDKKGGKETNFTKRLFGRGRR